MNDTVSYFELAAQEARLAACKRAKCGSVIVTSDGEVIGRGHNSPPLNDEAQRTCNDEFNLSVKPKYDKTCCIHAEWNAILDALSNFPEKIGGATLYFMRIDEHGGFTNAGEPFCTVCSRLALQSGLDLFALWNNGPDVKTTAEYNKLSYDYYRK